MFENIPKDAFEIISYLFPGFLCAWVFYGLTSHPKPAQFERVIQAIIYTFIIQTILIPTEWILIFIGEHYGALRAWDHKAQILSSTIIAIAIGFIFAFSVNTDYLYKILRKIKLTTRTSHPSDWFYVFSNKVTYVILHLKDGRRLYGWPKEWPTEVDKGHFYIMAPSWITSKGKQIELPELDGILISSSDVKWVEFLNFEEKTS